jgi:hypothetical protein
MALDASIYGRFQPKSAASYAAEFEQLAGMREQRQDNALARAFRQEQMGQARAQAERGNALRALQQGLAGKSDEEVAQGMRAAGFIDEAATYETSALDRQTKRNTVRTGEATAVKTEADAFSSALNQYATLLPRINSPQAAQLWVRSQYEDPRTGKVLQGSIPMEEALAEVPQDPQQLPQWRDRMAMGIAEYRKMLEEQRNPAPTTSIQEFKFAQERGEVPAGQTYTDWKRANARAGAATTSVSYGTPVQALDANGNPVFIQPTKDGSPPRVIPGVRPPMSAAEERSASEQRTRERTARQMVSGLEDARAVLDAGRATESGVGNLVDAAARLVGQTTIGAQDAARLEAMSGWLVANVPRMEGPQSNFDVQNYQTMAGKIGDRTVPIPERKAALAEVERLQRKYAEINGTPMPPATPPAAPTAMPSPDAIATELARRRGQ